MASLFARIRSSFDPLHAVVMVDTCGGCGRCEDVMILGQFQNFLSRHAVLYSHTLQPLLNPTVMFLSYAIIELASYDCFAVSSLCVSNQKSQRRRSFERGGGNLGGRGDV